VLTNLDLSIEKFTSKKSYSNDASRYLPIGPDTLKDQNLNWDIVYKCIYEKLLGLECSIKNIEEVTSTILDALSQDRKTKELSKLAEAVYLNENSLKAISPYTYLICEDKAKARTKTMESIFGSMLSKSPPIEVSFQGTNFIESIINSQFKSLCKPTSSKEDNFTYLPFLAEKLKADILTLSSNSEWLVEDLSSLVELYSFLYLTQLSLHLGLPNQRFNKPKSQEVYFLLENEKASKERHECNIKGYSRVLSNTKGMALDIFSDLGYLELISAKPIWQLENLQLSKKQLVRINELNRLLCDQFDIEFRGNREALEEAINEGLLYHRQLFKKSSQTSNRVSANLKVFTAFKDGFSRNFKKNRTSAGGWYFQLDIKTILLLTNLIVKAEPSGKLLIDDVIDAFKARGIYFDLKTRSALIEVYENIGNIEKLSDSGDAINVKSTI